MTDERFSVKILLDAWVAKANRQDFIPSDPVSLPRQFVKKQDIEIAAFWTAILSWGQRQTIINKATQLFGWMDGEPHKFIIEHSDADRKPFLDFRHRTFQADDALYFLHFLQQYYRENESLESAFIDPNHPESIRAGLEYFHRRFTSDAYMLPRTAKHISTPARNSACKRLNMFLRWMVRQDEAGVDFGIWQSIRPSALMIPLDVHVARVARHLGLLTRSQNDWKAVEELTSQLRRMDAADPIRYDFALFSIGIEGVLLKDS